MRDYDGKCPIYPLLRAGATLYPWNVGVCFEELMHPFSGDIEPKVDVLARISASIMMFTRCH